MEQRKKVLRPESLLKFSAGSRLPIIVQSEVAECGLACLAMIACYNGLEIGMTNLRSKFSISSHGTNLKDIMNNTAGHFNERQ